MDSKSDISTSGTKKFWLIGAAVAVVLVVVTIVVVVVVKPFDSTKSSPPPVDCVVSDWDWGNCGYDGLRPGTRTVVTPSANGGTACPPLTTTQPCDAPVDCVVSDWNWDTNCSYDGIRPGTRTVITPSANGGVACPTQLSKTQPCNAPVDCVVSDWKWGDCLYDGIQNGTRQITTAAANGGLACPTQLTTTRSCNAPVDCVVSDWSSWSSCGRDRKQTATRTVLKDPKNGGVACPTQLSKTQDCNTPPVDCVVSDWKWGDCGSNGKQNGTRTVVTPSANGGNGCPALTTTQDCDPPVDCVVADPVVYGPCNYSTQSQSKTLSVVTQPKNGGKACGDLTETQNCTTTGPYVYTTQVFAGQSLPMTGTSFLDLKNTIFSQSGIPTGWGPVNFTSYGGLCVIDLNFTASTKSANNVGTFALIIDGVAQLPLIKFCFNQENVHCTVPGVYLSVYLSPGVHTIGLYVNYIPTNLPVTVDSYDKIWLRVIEYSQSLVGGLNPSVYVTTLFNQTSSGSSSYSQSGIPPNWTKSATTYGGQCIIDLNFSAFNKNADEGVNFALMIDGQVQYPLIYFYFNIKYKHQSITASFTTKSLDPGTHTFAIYISWGGASGTTVDPWDYLNMRITEFANNLTMSNPKLINIIPVLYMIQPTTGDGLSLTEDNPGKWDGNFTTNGGTCAFNISYTFFSTKFLEVTRIMFVITNSESNTSINPSPGTYITWGVDSGKMRINDYYYLSNWNEHVSVNSNFIITGLPAGSHRIYAISQDPNKQLLCDVNDRLNIRIIEFSPQLTSGTPPELPKALTATTRPNYKGCYNDNVNSKRVFNQMLDKQTLAQCNTVAKTVGSPYFGMQNWQKSGGISAMDTGDCWFEKDSTLQNAKSQGSSTSCNLGTAGYNIGSTNSNALYETL